MPANAVAMARQCAVTPSTPLGPGETHPGGADGKKRLLVLLQLAAVPLEARHLRREVDQRRVEL